MAPQQPAWVAAGGDGGLSQFDDARVRYRKLVRARHGAPAPDLSAHADQAVLKAGVQVLDDGVGVNDAVLNFRVPDDAVAPDAGERPDVGVLDDHVLPDDDRSDDLAAHHPRGLGNDDPPTDPRLDDLALDIALQLLQQQVVGFEQVGGTAGVLPPPDDRLAHHGGSGLDQALDAVGDLVLAARRGRHAVEHLEEPRREAVQARYREVARRVLRLLDEPHDALAVHLRHPEGGRVLDLHERDEGVGPRLLKALDEGPRAVLEEVVPQVHAEVVLAHPLAGSQDRVPQPELLVLIDQGDLRTRDVADGVGDLLAREL